VAQKHRIAADIEGMPHFRSPVAHARKSPVPAEVPPPGASRDAHYAAVCAVLWSERELLESLACTVIVEQLMSHAGAARQAADVVQHDAMHRLGLQEVLRGAIVDALLTVTAAPPTASLRDIAARAPEPWGTILYEHRESLMALSRDLESLAGFEQLSLHEFLA
jgi:hypothetical protein